MNNDEKIALILSDLAKNFKTFLQQAKIKLLKQRHLLEDSPEYELVSDVMFSVIDKLKTTEAIDKYYTMVKEDKLRLYILKAISTNSSFYSAPFLNKKIKEKNQCKIIENYEYYLPDEEYNEDKFLLDASMVSYIKTMLVKPKAPVLFGEDWKYYTNLFNEYVSTPECTYNSLSIKYHIPRSSIAFHIRQVKDIIRKELNINNKIY